MDSTKMRRTCAPARAAHKQRAMITRERGRGETGAETSVQRGKSDVHVVGTWRWGALAHRRLLARNPLAHALAPVLGRVRRVKDPTCAAGLGACLVMKPFEKLLQPKRVQPRRDTMGQLGRAGAAR